MATDRTSFEGQAAIVTGAGRSLGRAYALGIARRGGAVVVNDTGGIEQPEGAWADRVVAEILSEAARPWVCRQSSSRMALPKFVAVSMAALLRRRDAIISWPESPSIADLPSPAR